MGANRYLRHFAAECIAALGLVFVVAGVTIWVSFVWPATETAQGALHELVVHVLFGLVILVLGVHTERSDLAVDEQFDVMVWCFSGFVFLVGLAVWGEVDGLAAGGLPRTLVSDIVVFGSMGGAFGVVAGVNWGRSKRNEELAAVNEEQRETLVLLTRLLRHDIRNDLAVVRGHVELVAEQADPSERNSLETIQRHVEGVLRLLADTDTLLKTLDSDREFERVDLSAVLGERVRQVREEHDDVVVRSDVPDGLAVVADGLIDRVFSNLLENAVAHNDPEELVVEVTATRAGGSVEVVVADNGVGIPEEVGEECFELGVQGVGSSGDGLGLYLVSRLVDVYGGQIVLEEAAEGATFRVTLPAAD